MTRRKNLKRLVRARAAKTGETYTTALHHVRPTPETDVTDGQAPVTCSLCGATLDAHPERAFMVADAVTLCANCARRFQALAERADGGEVVQMMSEATHGANRGALAWALRQPSGLGPVIAQRMQEGDNTVSPAEMTALVRGWDAAGRPPPD